MLMNGVIIPPSIPMILYGVSAEVSIGELFIAGFGPGMLIGCALMVFVWRRLGGLALALAMLTDYGRAARLGGRPPVWLDAPPAIHASK